VIEVVGEPWFVTGFRPTVFWTMEGLAIPYERHKRILLVGSLQVQ
jgi:hypothetical protein